VLSLAESQTIFRQAIAQAPEAETPSMLTAPRGAAERFAIYRRHHRESLTRHIRGRFPTVEWLVGTPRMMDVATTFVGQTPPSAPCMAEYGLAFAEHLASSSIGQDLPYLTDLALLDWHLGDVAVAIDLPAVPISDLAQVNPDSLPDLTFRLQPGLRYLQSDWPVDDLVRVRLSERAPEQLSFAPMPVAVEIRGARGRFSLSRLSPAALCFRATLAETAPLGDAMQGALDTEAAFDASAGLGSLFSEGLVTAFHLPKGDSLV
jgi:hypothetical protein